MSSGSSLIYLQADHADLLIEILFKPVLNIQHRLVPMDFFNPEHQVRGLRIPVLIHHHLPCRLKGRFLAGVLCNEVQGQITAGIGTPGSEDTAFICDELVRF